MNKTKTPEPPVLDEALLDRARAGDREALTVLYEATSLEVYRTVHALVRDEDLTLDIQQDAYLQAFSHLDQLREATAFLPWLRQIAVNAARAQLRKKRPLLFTELGGDPEADTPELPDPRPEDSPELALDRKENARLIREILGELSDGQRLLLGMYYYEQMSVREIAEKLELSPGTVKAQLYRGRKRVEDRVRRLEEQGVRLFGLSPLPFLLALLRRQEPGPETAGRTMAAVLPETVAVHTGRSFFQTLLGRVCLGLLTASVITGGVLGWRWYQSRVNIGDIRPTETLEINLRHESDEDPTAAPTEEINLSTEPYTEPPETTEPVTEPVETRKPVEADAHIGPDPTDLRDPSLELSDGQEPQHPGAPTQPVSSEAVPVSEETQGTEIWEPRFLRWYWDPVKGSGMDLYDQMEPSLGFVLNVEVQGGSAPTVYLDTPGVVTLSERIKLDSDDGIDRYFWYVDYAGSGTARLICEFNGAVQESLTIHNTAHPTAYQSAYWSGWSPEGKLISEKLVGESSYLTICVQGQEQPRVYTDHPELLSIRYVDNGPGTYWYESHTRWEIHILACGTAQVLIELAGKQVDAYTISVPDGPDSILRYRDIFPRENNTCRVSEQMWIDMLVEGNEIPCVYTDNPKNASLMINSYSSGETTGRVRGYHIVVYMLASGSANIICEYQGQIYAVTPINIIESEG